MKFDHGAQAVAVYAGRGVLYHHPTALIVGIDQGKGGGGKLVEEGFFGSYVGGEGTVVIEVVVAQIRKYGSGEGETVDPVLMYGVATHLHEDVVDSGTAHLGQRSLDGQGVGSGMGSGAYLIT